MRDELNLLNFASCPLETNNMSFRVRSLLVFLAGAIIPLALEPLKILPVGVIGFAAFFYLIHDIRDDGGAYLRGLRPSLILGWLFGFGQYFTGLYWLSGSLFVEADKFLWLLPFGLTLIPAYLASFTLVTVGLWYGFLKLYSARFAADGSPVNKIVSAVALASFYSGLCWAQTYILTGFPWNLPSMLWASWLAPAQLISFVGFASLSLIVLLWIWVPTALMMERKWVAASSLLIVSFGLAWGAGTWWLNENEPNSRQYNVAIIQPNIDQKIKWDPALRTEIIEATFSLTRQALRQSPRPDIIIWPETALPILMDEVPALFEWIVDQLDDDQFLVSGALRRAQVGDSTDYYNSVMVWDGDGELVSRSDKHHLVPFGEFLPMQDLLEAIGLEKLTQLKGGFKAGPKFAELAIPTRDSQAAIKLLPLICYEAIFPIERDLADNFSAIVNVTNDAWFGTSIGPYQHLAQTRLRSIELGLPLIRAANTGISVVYDGMGRELASIDLGQMGFATIGVPEPVKTVLPARYASWLFWIFNLMILLKLMLSGYLTQRR